jgi:integrase
MPLTVTAARNAKPGAKPYKLADEKGLYLFVTPSGNKSWRLKYRFGGKEKTATFGMFPDVTLAEAREKRDAAKAHLRANRDPMVESGREKRAAIMSAGTTFKATALDWHEAESPRWSPRHAMVVMNALERDVFPEIGKMPIADVDGPTVLKALRKIERRGAIETAKRVRGYISGVFTRAEGEHLVTGDPTAKLLSALKKTPKGAKQPALTTLPELWTLQRVVDGSSSTPMVKLASRLLALTALRVGVLRTAEWKEFHGIAWDDPDAASPEAVWRIPADKMKLDVENKGDEAFDHDVPLPPEAVAVLRQLYRITGRSRLLFPGHHSARVPMSDAAISTVYKRVDGGRYKGKHVPHGWRSSFSTIMNEWALEHGKEGDRLLIDLMLAHKPKGVSGSEFAYMRAKFDARRRFLAGVWAEMITREIDPPERLTRDHAL